MKAYYVVYDQNRELILASEQAHNLANPNQESYIKGKKQPQEKKSYEVGVFACNVYRLGAIQCMFNFNSRARDLYIVHVHY